jgi:hypothetical protein
MRRGSYSPFNHLIFGGRGLTLLIEKWWSVTVLNPASVWLTGHRWMLSVPSGWDTSVLALRIRASGAFCSDDINL